MTRLIFAICAVLLPATAIAADEVSGTNYLLGKSQSWPTGEKTGYWVSSARGVRVSDDPETKPEPTECHGSGYWDAEGTWSEGICRYGDAKDFVLSSYKIEKGAEEGVWVILNAGGTHAGITGSGTYKSTAGLRGAVVSVWEGEVTMPN